MKSGGVYDRTFPDHTTGFPYELGQKPAEYYEEFSFGAHSTFGGSFGSSYAPRYAFQLRFALCVVHVDTYNFSYMNLTVYKIHTYVVWLSNSRRSVRKDLKSLN